MRYGIYILKVHDCTVFWFSLVGTKSGIDKVVLCYFVKKPSKRKHSSIYSDASDASFVSHFFLSVVCCCKSDYKSSDTK